MINLSKSIRCSNCGINEITDLSDYVVSEDIDEREMGEEIEYTVEGEHICSNCNSSYDISGSVWEYPVGMYNDDSIEVS
ncbi:MULTISPECIES: hypothetical protein [Clostridium]|uniref:Mut7-C RNAse domain-containing protein n=1 Tax=Clostridium frigoriphilum TaxID=443253 RepID=A0ABU7UPX8_9CLOT|nr:hypothetical protein [Clostridium sp. DSM 17811]MBU3100699.1 hypothetical protein [Clostridium sp. DSM 17811]